MSWEWYVSKITKTFYFLLEDMDIIEGKASLGLYCADIDKDSNLVTYLWYTKFWEISDHVEALITLCDEKLGNQHVAHLSRDSFIKHVEDITGWEPVRQS